MKRKIISITAALALIPMPMASAADEPDTTTLQTAADAVQTIVKLDPSEQSPFNGGEFMGWGTSLCWWANRVGYSKKMTEQAAELFFSDKGLSLDIARYNLGGGDDPEHNHITRSDSKVPCYATGYDTNGNIIYDWTADANQRNIALAAKAANPNIYFEGFSNSPPYFMTNSGCSSGAENPNNDNLRTDDIDNFGKFIAETTKHFKDSFDIEFKSYSPMNEPDTDYWGYLSWKQEGCHYSPGNMQSDTIIATRRALDEQGLTDVLVAGMDETDLDKTIVNYGRLSDEAKTALGRIDTHTYNGSKRTELKTTAERAGKDLWMSEVDGGYDGFGLAKHIITDMNGMMPAAWVMWDIVDLHKDSKFQAPDGSYPEKDVSLNTTGTLWGVAMADHDTENIELANKYYAYGQFTRYIDPGDTVIASSPHTLAAYNKQTGDIKIVALNSESDDKKYVFDLSAFTKTGSTVKTIRSNNLTGDDAEHWAEIANGAELNDKTVTATVKAGTINTFIISGEGKTDYAVITGGKDFIKPGATAKLSVNSTLGKSPEWSVSDTSIADITPDGSVTAKLPGSFKVFAKLGGYTVSREFTVPKYKLSGTPSWGNANNAPADSADYTKAADGDLTTFFDGVGSGWVMYDCYMPYKLSSIKLAPRAGFADRTTGGTIQGSNDRISWTDLYTVNSALADGSYTEIPASDLASEKAYRYYRYTNQNEMTNIAEFLINGEPAAASDGEPTVTDIEEFTDDFESSTNIFDAKYGFLSDTGNTVFASGLPRFGRVFAPIGSTAAAKLSKPITLTKNDKFRITYNMFSGWEENGKYNVFFVRDENEQELVAIRLSGGGYTLEQVRIGDKNVLEKTAVAQCRSNPSGSRQGANGWDNANQPYRNNVGYNKTVEITIDGTGSVNVSLTGGMEDSYASGVLEGDITIGMITINGEFKSSHARTATYDNLDAAVIRYPYELEPPVTPEPTAAPELPDSGELIHLDFDSSLDSSSPYGKADALGTPVFETVDKKTCLKLDGTSNTAIKLTDANGNPLLTGRKNITIAFKIKPDSAKSWWFYAAPNNNSQDYMKEHYLGALGDVNTLTVERYNNSGTRSAAAMAKYNAGEWNDVMISVNDGMTSVYINGELAASAASVTDISEMLGNKSVAYIGKANWGSGEFATGYVDEFVIYNYALPLAEISRDGNEISYTSGYKEDMPFDMYIALKDKSGTLMDVKLNAESGSFTVPDDENYTITQDLWKGLSTMTKPVTKSVSDGAYLFVHFVGTESNANQEQIYFSVSQDGSTWKTLNGGAPVLTSSVGERGVRDPFIQRGVDGKYYIIATDLSIYNRRGDKDRWSTCQTAGSKSIVVWESDDLVNWSEANLVEVADEKAGCTWAPESIYDPEKEMYMVFWASKVSDDNYSKQRIYRSYTKDFKTFTPAEVYIDNETSAIDTTILENDGVYYRFTKDETYSAVTMMRSTSLSEGWEDVATYTINGSEGNKVIGYEGPTIYKLNGEDRFCLLLDYFSKSQGYKPFITDDITRGSFVSATDFSFDTTYRHGTVMPITSKEYKALVEKYGN